MAGGASMGIDDGVVSRLREAIGTAEETAWNRRSGVEKGPSYEMASSRVPMLSVRSPRD